MVHHEPSSRVPAEIAVAVEGGFLDGSVALVEFVQERGR